MLEIRFEILHYQEISIFKVDSQKSISMKVVSTELKLIELMNLILVRCTEQSRTRTWTRDFHFEISIKNDVRESLVPILSLKGLCQV